MKVAILGTILTAAGLTLLQAADPLPKFEAADVRVSPKVQMQFPRNLPAQNGRYELKQATIVDLIRFAYGFDNDKVLGGPHWLEMERFDIIAKVPADATPESQKEMLQSLLEERFKLVTHKDSKSLPTYALLAGKSPKLKEAGNEEQPPGCRPQSTAAGGAEGGIRLMMASGPGGGGAPTQLTLGPGMTVQYNCRNMTMAAFVTALKTMIGVNLGTNPVVEETGLKGTYNFDVRYSMSLMGPMMQNNADRITIFEAVDKQLGLKLEERPVATPVIVVDSVSRKPVDNPAGTETILPPVVVPTEFEVASIKLVEGPMGPGMRMMRFNMQPGGRFVAEGMPLSFFITRAFNSNNREAIAGIPQFANTDRYDVNAKVAGGGQINAMDQELLAPLILSLLKDRFKMTYHTEDRPVTAYTLVAGKTKMKKADPASRTYCKNIPAPPGSPGNSRAMQCQNTTMEYFAERLQNSTADLIWPVTDSTKLEGGWDFTLLFSMGGPNMAMMGGMPAPPPPPGGGGGGGMSVGVPLAGGGGGMASASEPMDGYTIFEAIEKQLGLKLEKQKRNGAVTVIDHLEQKPTEN